MSSHRTPALLVLLILAVALVAPPAASARPALRAAASVPPAAVAPVAAGGQDRDALVAELLDELLPGQRPPRGRALFAAVLASDGFVHREVGLFDLYVRVADGLAKHKEAEKLAERAAEGLAPTAEALARTFTGEQGVVSGRRFPVVLADSDPEDDGQLAFLALLALLDHCEDGEFSGFKPDLAVFTDLNKQAPEVFTWEVLLANVGHESIAQHDKQWFDHGVGYAAINLLVNRLFAKGGWGPPPPWLINGLVDEFDIQAYGDAWVAAGESVVTSWKIDGWHREGWEGFVPQGQQPPPPVKGPPPGLKPTFQKTVTADKWLARAKSEERHWGDLAKDLREDVPVSLAHMAAGRSFEKRDRAYARCVLHLLMTAAPEDAEPLLTGLDHESRVGKGGMRTGDPLPVIAARALGGVPGVEALQALSMGEFLESIDRQDLIEKVAALGGEALLGVADHREQAAVLYGVEVEARPRQELFLLIVEIENYRQLQQWELLGEALDSATRAALSSSKRFPEKERDLEKVIVAYREALAQEG